MLKKLTFFLMYVFVVVVLYSFVTVSSNFEKNIKGQENHPPVVKIITPANNNSYAWNTPIPYKIKVSDPEDGESEFQEISSNDVFLQVKYLADATKASAELKQGDKSEPTGLTAIKSSNCLNCHAFTGKLIGPSFYDISKRYPNTKLNLDILEKHIREGSSGVWGNVTMPTHTELTKEETREMVTWILENAADPNVSYFRGTEGYFTIKPPVETQQQAAFVVTASYTDHGVKDKPKQNQRGQDVIIIHGK